MKDSNQLETEQTANLNKGKAVFLTASVVAIFHVHIATVAKISAPRIFDDIIRYWS